MKKTTCVLLITMLVYGTGLACADDFTQKLNSYSQAQQHKEKANHAIYNSFSIHQATTGTLEMLTAIYNQNEEIIKLLKDLNEKADKQKTK